MKWRTEPVAGELREWVTDVGGAGVGVFMVIGVDGVRVDVIRKDGTRDGVFKEYLIRNSRVITTS